MYLCTDGSLYFTRDEVKEIMEKYPKLSSIWSKSLQIAESPVKDMDEFYDFSLNIRRNIEEFIIQGCSLSIKKVNRRYKDLDREVKLWLDKLGYHKNSPYDTLNYLRINLLKII
jgi:hypothetical protein